jgi:hypothetical protein
MMRRSEDALLTPVSGNCLGFRKGSRRASAQRETRIGPPNEIARSGAKRRLVRRSPSCFARRPPGRWCTCCVGICAAVVQRASPSGARCQLDDQHEIFRRCRSKAAGACVGTAETAQFRSSHAPRQSMTAPTSAAASSVRSPHRTAMAGLRGSRPCERTVRDFASSQGDGQIAR